MRQKRRAARSTQPPTGGMGQAKQAAAREELPTRVRRTPETSLSGSSRRKASLHGRHLGVKEDPDGTSSVPQ